jgi:methylated-DNA-[protein]-cysteine S-methyltransferase
MSTLRFHICETAAGHVGIVISERGLRATTLPHRSAGDALREVIALGASEPASPADLGGLPERVRAVASGRESGEGLPIDWDGLTPFRRAVLQTAMRIPAGETRSYGWLAQRVGKPGAARAVGRVMATNPLPLVVPCHRVIGSDGGLHGFGGGLEMKERLLRAEGALAGAR